MNMMPGPTEPMVFTVSDTPQVEWMQREFTRCGGQDSSLVRREQNDRIRYNRWKGRTADYKKHKRAIGADPVPWEGGWDGRVYTADSVIQDLGDVLQSAFSRAQFKMKPNDAQDIARAASAEKVIKKYVERDRNGLNDESEFCWQFGLSGGWSVWHVFWDRQLAMKMEKVDLPQLMEAAQMAMEALQQPGIEQSEQFPMLRQMAAMPDRVLDPGQEESLALEFQKQAKDLAAQLFEGQRGQYGDSWLKNYKVSIAKCRKMVRELRETGETEFPMPYLAKDAPCVVAREPGIDYFCPSGTTDSEKARWHIVREWMTPEQLRENEATDGWDSAWVESAIKTAGKTSTWASEIRLQDVELDDDSQSHEWSLWDSKSGMVEVCYFYAQYSTDEGVPQRWCTVFCPAAVRDDAGNPTWAAHYPLSGTKSGFIPYRWSRRRRGLAFNMSVNEVIGADQASIKRSIDMLVDRQDVEINPPWFVKTRLGQRYQAAPGGQVPRKYQGDVEPVPPPTGNPDLAFKLIEAAERRIDNYFGLMTEHVLPARWQMKLQSMVGRFLSSAEEMFKQYWGLIQENADQASLQRISGGTEAFPTAPEEIAGEFDVSLYFDVKDLDMEFVFKKLDAVAKMAVPMDRAGIIDMAGLVRMIVLAIDPSYAGALLTDKQGASQRVHDEVDREVARMYLGNEGTYVENDPTAEMKHKFIEDIIQRNRKYLGALGMAPGGQLDPIFAEHIQKYTESLQMSVKQEQNKEIGRTGVKPDEAAAA